MRPSLETAVHWYDVAGWVLVGALVAGAICTVVIVFMGVVKEGYWDESREAARLQIARLEAETAQAHSAIADANVRTKEAELRIEELRRQTGPRILDPEIFLSTLEGSEKAENVEILYSPAAGDGRYLVSQLHRLLGKAEWPSFSPFEPLDANSPFLKQSASFNPKDGTSAGIVLWASPPDIGAPKSAAWRLQHAIGLSLGRIGFSAHADSVLKPGNIRVVILPR